MQKIITCLIDTMIFNDNILREENNGGSTV